MNRSLIASVLGLATAVAILLAAADRAGAMVAAPTPRAAHRHAAVCHPAPKRHGKKRKAPKCRRATKTQGVKSGAGSTSSASSDTPPVTTATVPPAPIVLGPDGSNPPQLPVTTPTAWDEPALNDPITIQLSPTNFVMSLNQSQDYILKCPSGRLTVPNALNIAGGHNVSLKTATSNCPTPIGPPSSATRAARCGSRGCTSAARS